MLLISQIFSLKHFLFLLLGILVCSLPIGNSKADYQNLNGLWFICEFSISNSPPDDQCKMLDNDGFLVDEGEISHLKIKNSQQEGCRGNRKGHCFRNGALGLKAKKRKIGDFIIGSNWVEVDYLSCTQRFWFKKYENYWHGWPDDKRCFWTRDKEFYVQRYLGEIIID